MVRADDTEGGGPEDAAPWRYETVGDLELDAVARLRRFPREPDMSVYALRWLFSLGLRAWLKTFNRYRVDGRHHLPIGDQSYVVVANHASHMDALCLLAALPLRKVHRTFPAAAADYFFQKLPHTVVAGIFINALPFDRLHNKSQSLQLCRLILDQPGNVLILFPEGTRSPTGQLAPFKPGIGFLTAGTDTPVVPCHLGGPARVLPRGSWLPRPVRLQTRIGAPRRFQRYERDKPAAMEIARLLQADVEALAR
jgi:1-acyl-sn-glycerol-3-phosphate acyltransferase